MAKKKKETAKKKAVSPKKEPKKVITPKSTGKKKASPKKEIEKIETKTAVKKTETKKSDPKQVKGKPVKAEVQQNTATKTMTAGTGKKRLLISYDKLPHEVIDIIRMKYPYGYSHDLKEVKGIDNKKFYVLSIELPEVVYLVKVDLRKPFKIEEAEEEDIFTPEEAFAGGEEENFPAEDLEPIEGEGDGEEDGKKKKKKDDDDDDI